MITFVLFAASGIGIVAITLAKRREERKKTAVLVLRLISLGDERLRKVHQEALRQYSHGKEKFGFWVKKQLPLKVKSLWNRFQTYASEKLVEYLGDMRGSRLLKRPDGISEFFKNISEIEKGGGEINETLQTLNEDFYIQTSEERHAAQLEGIRTETVVVEAVEKETSQVITEAPKTSMVKPLRPKKSRASHRKAPSPRSKKVTVLEVLD